MTRKELREAVYRRLVKEYPPPKLSRHLVYLALENTLDLILDALEQGEPVVIHGFGRFSPRKNAYLKKKSYPQLSIAFKSSPLLNRD